MAYYLVLLSIIILPAASVNNAMKEAKDIITSLPGWFPEHYMDLKLRIRRKFKKTTGLTLWKIYVIDKSLLLSLLGTLVTYGILIGTLGTVRSSK
ncbi:hypothetical protein AVEN_219675-1 [Araneus ventricosus]|uniref:Uncharacterized protein n=1 Tax=Araneus ventricosus TaxID=182803 RepID=A0A4Y2RCK5_ARAVE|nr:hypothetical protein AVEN_219675-1 [Araneus ventricosus]